MIAPGTPRPDATSALATFLAISPSARAAAWNGAPAPGEVGGAAEGAVIRQLRLER